MVDHKLQFVATIETCPELLSLSQLVWLGNQCSLLSNVGSVPHDLEKYWIPTDTPASGKWHNVTLQAVRAIQNFAADRFLPILSPPQENPERQKELSHERDVFPYGGRGKPTTQTRVTDSYKGSTHVQA